MNRKLSSAILILTLCLCMSAVVFAGNVEGEKLKKVNKVEILKPELGDSKTIFMQDSLSISLKLLDRDERYMNLVKVEPIFLELHEEAKKEDASEKKEAIVKNQLSTAVKEVIDADKMTESVKVTLEDSIGTESIEEENDDEKIIEENVLTEDELYENLIESKEAFDSKKEALDQLLERAKELKITLDGTEPTNLKETNTEEINLRVKYKKVIVTLKELEKNFDEDFKAYKKFFEVYIIEKEEIVLEEVLLFFNYSVDNVEEGNYRLEIVNTESGVIDAEMEFIIISKEDVVKEVTENGLLKIRKGDSE